MASDKISITGERIRELYEDHGYSQKEFADFLGISTAQLRRYEKDPDQSIRSDLLITMAKHFHVSTDYLLGLTPTNSINVDGLPTQFVSHIVQLIEDYKAK